jgi:CubicO group peptidase (beta-lactamase class C family)
MCQQHLLETPFGILERKMGMNGAALNDLDLLIDEAMQEWQVPGLALAVVVDGEPTLVKVYGQRDVEAGLPVTVDTQFLLCSITKSFTAAGLAMLVDERRLDWTKPVREYIPEFRLHDPIATERVTVQDLLCHHSGLPRHDWVWMPGDRSREEMLAALRYLEPSRDVRASYQYSNLGYMVAGMVAERITGQPWEDFTRTRIMTPLGMTSVGFSSEDLERAEDSARPYVMADNEPGVFVRKRAPLWPIRDTPAGGINAAISDMARYLGFYLAGGCCNGTELLSPATLRAMQTPRVHSGRSEFEEIGDHHYGFGFASHHYRGERVVSHSGGWIGWGTLMTMLPARRLGTVILTNRAPSPVTDIVAFAVFDRLSGKDPIPWLDRFRTRRREAIVQRAVDLKAHRAARKPAGPSRPLAEYAGDYEHPGYGRITIEVVGAGLNWQFHGLSGELNHRHYDVFEVPENPVMLSPDRLAVTFAYDREGNIDRLSVPFESLVADIVFTRVAGGDVLDPAFRAACVGTYQCGPARYVVALDGDRQLTLSPANQPTYRLVPHRDRTFTIEALTGFRVEFERDESGVVNAITFHQPNGTFVGRRVSG